MRRALRLEWIALAILVALGFSGLGCEPLVVDDPSADTVVGSGPKPDEEEPDSPDEPAGDGDTDEPGPTHFGPYHFVISESDTDPLLQTGAPQEGYYFLYVWLLSGRGGMSALEADVVVTGDDEFSPVFAALPPNLALHEEGGSDILLAAPGCPEGPTLLGSLLIIGDGSGVHATMTFQNGVTGVVGCGNQTLYGFTCTAYDSR